MDKIIFTVLLGLLFMSGVFLFQQGDVYAQNQLSPEFETALEEAQKSTSLFDPDFPLDTTPPEPPPELSFWGKTKKFFSDIFRRTPEPEVKKGPLRVFEGIDRSDRLTNPLDSDSSIYVDVTPPEDPEAFEDDLSFFQKVGRFFSGLFNGSSEREEAVREAERMLESVRENQEKFQRERDAALKQAKEKLEQTKEKIRELEREDSIKLVEPPDLGFEEVVEPTSELMPEPTPKPVSINCSWVIKYVGDYIYCIVSDRPCVYSTCTFSRYFLDGTIDIIVGKCQDVINPKSTFPLCSDLGI